MTPAQLRRVHVALDQCGGRVKEAAAILGIPTNALDDIIEDHPELQAYSPEAQAPTDDEAALRMPVVKGDAANALALAEAAGRQEKALAKSMASMGVKATQMDRVLGFYKFGRDHLSNMRHLMGGGICQTFLANIDYRDELLTEIKAAASSGEVEREKMLREDLGRINQAINASYDRVMQAYKIEMGVQAAKQAAKGYKKKPGAPAFPPLAVQANGPLTIVQGGQQPPAKQVETAAG